MSEFERLKRIIEEEATTGRDPMAPLEGDGPVPTWSFSTLKAFEQCPYRVYLSKVGKIREEQGTAAARGNQVHEAAEEYVRGETDTLSKDLEKFALALTNLRDKYAEGTVEIEQEWGFDKHWNPCAWDADELWGKMKLDVFVRDAGDSCQIIDYKTGKRRGNEIKHTDQGIVYVIGAMMRYPEIEYAQVEFWYTDEGTRLTKSYTREHVLFLIPNLERRAYRLTTCKDFPPRPSAFTCKWCSHKATDSCDYAEGA